MPSLTANADLKQARLLQRIDDFVTEHGLSGEVPGPDRPAPTRLGAVPTEVDLERFTTVVWATGYRPSYPWLDPAAFDRRGRVAHDGGVSPVPGLYVLGLPFLRRRRSNLIAGVGDDAAELLPHLLAYLHGAGPPRVERRSCRSVIEGAGEQRVADPMDHRIDGA